MGTMIDDYIKGARIEGKREAFEEVKTMIDEVVAWSDNANVTVDVIKNRLIYLQSRLPTKPL